MACLSIAAWLLKIPLTPAFGLKVGLISETATSASAPLGPIATWIGRLIWMGVALVVLGVLFWVTRHVLRRPRAPDA
ncbi:hypothetical protein ASD79_03720 [Caulobacter sp. Root655]|nr:hypothetical protein ASD79_03720 [Caulobacter sp. Root655]